MEILILLLYYERPTLVKNALTSITNLDYDNWRLAFIDDGSKTPGKPIAEKILKDHLDKVDFYNTGLTIDDKVRRGGSSIGEVMNSILDTTKSEIAIMLCDDDALVPDYFNNLSRWAQKNPTLNYCYSHVILYDPSVETYDQAVTTHLTRRVNSKTHKFSRKRNWFNKTQELYPEAKLDASQVAWRTSCNELAKFPTNQTCHLDSKFYKAMGEHFGRIKYSGFFGQFKGLHDDTLSIRDEAARHSKKYNLIYKVKE